MPKQTDGSPQRSFAQRTTEGSLPRSPWALKTNDRYTAHPRRSKGNICNRLEHAPCAILPPSYEQAPW